MATLIANLFTVFRVLRKKSLLNCKAVGCKAKVDWGIIVFLVITIILVALPFIFRILVF